MSVVLLTTKLYPPPARPNLVTRRRLTMRLDDLLRPGRKLALLCAPAGFGKTTLLADWLQSVERRAQSVEQPTTSARSALERSNALRFAWLSLDEADNDPTRFWSYLIAALDAVQPGVGEPVRAALTAPQSLPIEAILTALINALAVGPAPEPMVLVLDDYHIIDVPAIHAGLTFLLDHLPPQLRLILTSRADPPLPLARWRARGELTELRAAELRFTADEAATFLTEVMAIPLGTEDLLALEARTEGWIAGLHLAALAMHDRTDLSSFVAAFTGSNRFVVDYLAEEVFAQQPGHIQTFLLQTSILGRMCGALCDAVLGLETRDLRLGGSDSQQASSRGALWAPQASQAYSQRILEQLEHTNLFTVPLDDTRQWYRYHQLFAEVLRERLLSGAANAMVAALHQRASGWFEQHGLVPEAVQHALACADWMRAADLIEQHGLALISRGQVSTLQQWMHALPQALIPARPALATIRAITLMFDQQLAAAELSLQTAEAGLTADISSDQAQIIQGRVATLRSNILRTVGDLPRAIALAQHALELLPESEAIMRGIATLILARAYEVSGDVTATSEQLAAQVVARVRAAGDVLALVTTWTTLARLQVLQGRLRAAAATYAEAVKTIPQEPALAALRSPLIGYDVGWGDLLREWNDLAAAEQHLSRGTALARDIHTVDANAVMLGYTALAHLQQARGDGAGANATLISFADLARKRGFARLLLAHATAIDAQLRLAQGDLSAAVRWMETSGLGLDDALSYPREREYLTFARVLIAQRQSEAALRLLDRLLQDAEAKARRHSAIEILILRALARDAQGARDAASVDIARALALAESEGYTRIFVDEGAPMATLLAQVPKDGSAIAAYAVKLLAAFLVGLEARDLRLADAVQASSLKPHCWSSP